VPVLFPKSSNSVSIGALVDLLSERL
jgi:hypothetical protein